jgi:alpha-glucan,water dikinase
LEGFAGAGLYDSVTVAPTVPKIVNYADEWLIWDAPRRTALMVRIPFPKS